MRYAIVLTLLLVGCSESATELTAWQKSMREGSVDALQATKAVEAKADEAVVILKDNTAALARIEKQLEASLVKSNPNGKEVIQSASEPPAKENTQQALPKVATPGASPETLTELATRLYSQGVNVHNKTREELEAIDAQMQGVKSSPVQYQSRPTYSKPAGTVCVNGRCFVPQVSSRRRR